MSILVELILSVLLVSCAVALTRVRDLFAILALLSFYSAVIAMIFAEVGAVDVAFTELVVGTGVSTAVLMSLFRGVDPNRLSLAGGRRRFFGGVAGLGVGAFLFYGVHALPEFGSPDAPAAAYLAPEYISRNLIDMATPNVVTAVLADYRSFDTLIESAVVVTAVLACLLIMRRTDDWAV